MRTCFLKISSFLLLLFVMGCADMSIPTPEQIIKNPIGLTSLKPGMTKNEVISICGIPDIKSRVSNNDWSGTREEWFYKARYSALPVNAGYLSEDMYVYFDGENLTNVSSEPLGQAEK